MKSLKARLLLGMISGMVALLIMFSFIIYHSISRALFNQFDVSLESSARMLSASVEQDKEEIGFEFDVERMPEFAGGKRSAYYEFWRNDGTVAGKSPSLGDKDLTQFESISRSTAFKSFKMKDGQHVRAVAVNFIPRSETDDPNRVNTQKSLVLVVAKDAGGLLAQLRFLKNLLSVASIGIIVIACIMAAAVVRRGLKPLNTIAMQIDGIRESNLKSRISGDNLPAEIVPIQRQLNSLLTRLEVSFERQRTFNADVAHELRTPLAGICSIVEVTLMRVRDASEYQAALSDCLSIITKMHAMVDNLLMLARVESGQMTFAREKVKLAELVNSCWQPFSGKAANAAISFENNISADMICESGTAGLSIAFSNLLDNAAEYTNPGGKIRVTAQQTEEGAEIVFENTGSKLTSQQAAEAFECFWRGDSSRSGTGVHCGLGLVLVKRIVEALGGSVHAVAQGDLFSIHLMLPSG
jgi:two-component system, OmpR family, heavy metal sensor histidine kinase CusS